MNNSFLSEQIAKTGNIDSNLISLQFKLSLLVKFMQIKFKNSKLKQSELTDQLWYSKKYIRKM